MNKLNQKSIEKKTTRRRAPLWVYAFHILQERIRPYRWRRSLAALIAKTRPNVKAKSTHYDLEHLQRDGFAMLDGLIDAAWVDRVRASLEKRLCQDRWRRELGLFRHDAMPVESHVADIDDVVDIPEVLAVANHPRVLGVVGAYLGCQPTIDSIMAWWSLPGHDQAENEQFFHRDNDSIRFLKLFIYLSDVGPDCGPHVYVRGSHAQDGCYERRRYQDKEVERTFGTDKVHIFQGPAGTVFIEDTYGLHKGSLPTGQRRLLLQIRYSTVPSIFMSRSAIKANPKSSPSDFDKYTNRFILNYK
jgi:hypothetical protein